jgi:hypothetical protein
MITRSMGKKKFPQPYPVAPLTGGTPLQPWMTLGIKNRHERDNKIHFDEPTHIYTVNGSSKGNCSTTTFIHHFFPHFDADKTIKNMMKSPKWPESKWFGMTPEAIKAAWNANGREASELGTAIHLACEMVMNGAEDQVDAEVKKTAEWSHFKKYWEIDSKKFEPWRTEWEVWDSDLKLSGSIDMVYRNKTDGTFAIYDWKRAKDMKLDNPFENGYGPCAHLPNCNYAHYKLQLNIYKYYLETHYGVKVSEMALVVLHPNNDTFQVYPVPPMEKEVQAMLEARRRAVKRGLGHVADFEEPKAKPMFLDD